MILIDGGKAKRQPVTKFDIVKGVEKIIADDMTKGQIYEMGGGSVYTLKELYEFMGNNLNYRPFYNDYSYDDLMRMYLGPNSNWEKSAHYFIIRPDCLTTQRMDNIIKPKEGIKTFDDLDILPGSIHHYIADICNWLLQKQATTNLATRDWAEIDADDEGH